MEKNLNKRKYISEDEGAGKAAPIIEIISSLFLVLVIIWFLFESLKINIPDNNFLTAPSLLPIIFSISILVMLLLIFKNGVQSLNIKTIYFFSLFFMQHNLRDVLFVIIYFNHFTNKIIESLKHYDFK